MHKSKAPILTSNHTDEFYPEEWDIRTGAIALIDKELGWTSFDVVKKVRGSLSRAYQKKRFKVGHAGTLDPLATGLLILLMGKATKEQDNFMRQDKVYEGAMELGYTTASYDAEQEKISSGDPSEIDLEGLRSVSKKFLGDIVQIPPMYSAIKHKGKPLYKYARKGQSLKVKKRVVTIHNLEILSFSDNIAKFRVNCSSGTYIRSLAHDMGQLLGCGAYLTQLRRISIGDLHINDAMSVNELVGLIDERYVST